MSGAFCKILSRKAGKERFYDNTFISICLQLFKAEMGRGMKSIITRTVMRNGIQYEGYVYFHVHFIPFIGTQVFVKKKKDGLKVYDAKGKPICTVKKETFTLETLEEVQRYAYGHH
jgi:hypothetical protein